MSGSPRRRQVPVAQRRAQLADAALRVMKRDGAWTVTTRAVAAEAGVPHGSVHYAFTTKEALLEAVIVADTEHAIAYLLAAAQSGTPAQALAAATGAYAQAVRSDPETELVLQELTLMAAREPRLRDLMTRSHETYRAGMTALLTELARRHDARWDAPVGAVADHLLGALFGAGTMWLVERDDARFDAALADLASATAARLVRLDPSPAGRGTCTHGGRGDRDPNPAADDSSGL